MLGLAAAAAGAAIVAWLCLNRRYLNISTETDFLGLVPNAARYQRGEPMLIEFHPPAYPILLGSVHSWLGDWMASGLLISWVSAVVALLASFHFFSRTAGAWAGLGAMAALGASPVFLAYSAQATTDGIFVALWMVTLAVTAAAVDGGGRGRWLVAGILAACAALTRTNGVTLAPVLLLPALTGPSRPARIGGAAMAVVGFMVPVAAWATYASMTGSPLFPTQNHVNLALTYFAEGSRISGDSRRVVQQQFNSTWEVLSHDPAHIVRIYLEDLANLPGRLLTGLMWMPLALLGAAGALAWLPRWRSAKVRLYLILAVVSVLLINMKAFEARFYLFLVPMLGASVGLATTEALQRAGASSRTRAAVAAALALLVSVNVALAARQAVEWAEDPRVSAQLSEAVPATQRATPEDAVILARKRALSFHAGRRGERLPPLASLAELHALLVNRKEAAAVYVFIGLAERRMRADLADLLLQDPLPDWLEATAQGQRGGTWRLLRFVDPRAGRPGF